MQNHSKNVASMLISAIANKPSWSRVWMRGPAVNCITKKTFRGANRLTLTLTATRNGWSGNRWGTDAQWLRKGFFVPRGTESARIMSMIEAKDGDEVFIHYGVKRIAMIRPHEEYCAIQVGDDDSWNHAEPNVSAVLSLVNGAFDGIRLSVPPIGTTKSNEVATRDERYCTHLVRAALRLTIESQMISEMPESMTNPDIINLAAEMGAAFVLNDYGMVAECLRDQPTVRRWSDLLIGNPEIAIYAAGLAQHAIDRMSSAGSATSSASESLLVMA